MFVIGTVLFTLGSIACGRPGHLFLTISRASRVSAALRCSPTALALLADAFSGKDQGYAFGVFGATTGVPSRSARCCRRADQWPVLAMDFFVNIPICFVAIGSR